MFKEGRTYIITDIDGLKKRLNEQRPSVEYMRKIAKSIADLDSKDLKKLYNE